MNCFLIAFTLTLALLPQEPSIYNTWKLVARSGDEGETRWYAQDVRPAPGARFQLLRVRIEKSPQPDRIYIRYYTHEYDCARAKFLWRQISYTTMDGKTYRADDISWEEAEYDTISFKLWEHACRDRSKDEK